ncbi:MAG TPA: hypothetical protein VFN25_00075, partial [Dokdonella sp.]|nr:hypothetical protein [Dokdonella sp.]
MVVDKTSGAVLIVATNREDRRFLFEALDTQEFDAIYTAKDIGQARTFLVQEPQIDLILLEFLGDATDAVAFCNELQHHRSKVPVIGIFDSDTAAIWPAHRSLPSALVDRLSSPVDP